MKVNLAKTFLIHLIGRTDAEVETPVLWPPHVKSWLIGKDPDAGRDWGEEEKGTTEDEMAGWHHRLDAHEFGWTPGVGDGQGGRACCDSWGRKESDTTERVNWTELNWTDPCMNREYKHPGRHVVYTLCMDSRLDSKLVVYSPWGLLILGHL